VSTQTQQSTRDPVGRPARVLCVCEGNICRSPVAALLLQAALGPDVSVTSAGTGAVVGAPVAPPMAELLRGRAIESEAFRARQLLRNDLEDADLVLTMTTRQRRQAVELAPSTVRRTFTLRELARLLGEVDPTGAPSGTVAGRLRWALPAAAAKRRYLTDPGADDIDDPYGRTDADYRRAFAEVDDAVEQIAAVVGDVPPSARRTTDAEEAGQSTAGSDSRPADAHNVAGGTTTRPAASASS
jgi:low molecular weight protein-tyrosine phosphatase